MKSKVKKRNYGWWLLCCSLWLLFSLPVRGWEGVQGVGEPGSGQWKFVGAGSPRPYRNGDVSDLHNRWYAASGMLLTRKDSMAGFNWVRYIKNFETADERRWTQMDAVRDSDEKRYSSSGKAKSGVAVGVKSVCSNQNIETLTTQMLRDLPHYANRTTQRARPPLLSKLPDVYSYMLVAGKPDFTPLPLNPGGYSTDVTKNASPGVEQVFFTTLERLYTSGKAVNLQQFHWLFLTKTNSGWRLVMMFSQTGYYQAKKLPTPPQDSSNGDIAQAINIWLRDCQAGKVGVRSGKLGEKSGMTPPTLYSLNERNTTIPARAGRR